MDFPASQSQSSTSSSFSPYAPINGIVTMKNVLRSLGTLVTFMVGFGIGIAVGSSQVDQSGKNSQGVAGEDFFSSPVLYGVALRGKLAAKNNGSLVLEKEGKQLTVFTQGVVDIIRIGSAQADSGVSSALNSSEKLENVAIGSDLTVQVIFNKEAGGSKLMPLANTIVIN